METSGRPRKEIQILCSELLAAEEKERRRIARDIHDNLSSYLVALKFELEGAINVYRKNEPAMEDLVEFVTKIRHAIGESWRIMTDLYPSVLEDFGIRAAVLSLCERFQEKHPDFLIIPELSLAEDAVSETLKFTIFRIIRVGLYHAATHSKAAVVSILLQANCSAVEIEFRIDDADFEHEGVHGESNLDSVQALVELTGGSFSTHLLPSQGLVIKASWAKEMVSR